MIAARLLLVGMLLTGCGTSLVRQIEHRFHAERLVERAEDFARRGEHGEARRAYQQALAEYPADPAAERALFGLARLSLASENAQRSYREAHRHFDLFVTRYPSSAWAADARIWRDLLATLLAEQAERAKWRQEAERRGREAQRATQAAERQRLEAEKATQVAEHQRLAAEKATQAAERVQRSLEQLKRLEGELEQRR